MKTKAIKLLLAALLCSGTAAADTTIVNASLGYTIYLPDDWVLEAASDSQHYFYDSTYTFASQLSLVRHHRDAEDFPTPVEWTRAHFIAYKLVAEYSADPWGAVLYYDSSATSVQGSLWAPELYVMFFPVDTAIGAWAEYTRFTASGNFGYELYALGDTADMLENLATYAAILQGIDLPGVDAAIRFAGPMRGLSVLRAGVDEAAALFDARGRRMKYAPALAKGLPGGVYFTPGQSTVLDLK